MKRFLKSTSVLLSSMKRLDNSIFLVDGKYAQVPEYGSSYIIQEGDNGVIVEPTTNRAVPLILEALEECKISPDNIQYVIITHVHLDHAGGAALLLSKCKNAKILAHPKAAKFVVNPAPLLKGAAGVYGKETCEELYGKVEGVDESRVVSINDNQQIKFGDRVLTFKYTLGHATHHMVIHDSKSSGVFTGDSFGLNYPCLGEDYLFPSTTPIDFVPSHAHAAIDLIMEMKPTCAYLSHFGMWKDMEKGAKLLHERIDEYHEICKQIPKMIEETEDNEKKIREIVGAMLYEKLEETTGKEFQVLHKFVPTRMDVMLNAYGCYVYVKRRLKKNLEV